MKVLAIFTCFNRKDKTENCIRKLTASNPTCEFTFVVADDNSTDGTQEILTSMQTDFDIHLLKGDGNLFYSGGMRLGMDYALNKLGSDYDYMLMMNDDVEFYDHCIEKMAEQSIEQNNSIIVGATEDSCGKLSYSAMKVERGYYFSRMPIDRWKDEADTFNANCVLIPYEAFKKTGSIDSVYVHSLGDFDYGLALKRNGYKLHVNREYVGCCNNNPSAGTWTDRSLSRRERIRKKESVKGAPTKQWFHFLRKNFGLPRAVFSSMTPFFRILVKR
ncbi:MAG: glycosyltransferase family 2 protein [Oscillospiraceae bacterium]|nr:glycosyltransferase family 2 protein [Oscillospiraceae bacterium]